MVYVARRRRACDDECSDLKRTSQCASETFRYPSVIQPMGSHESALRDAYGNRYERSKERNRHYCARLGAWYEGGSRGGLLEGRGVLWTNDGTRCECTWASGKRNGVGIESTRDGSIWVGQYTAGFKATPYSCLRSGGLMMMRYDWTARGGTVSFGDGRLFTGKHTTGGHYIGCLKSATSVYNGEIWRTDKCNGLGAEEDSLTGEAYLGEWVMGQKMGRGRVTLGDGSIVDGVWEDGVMARKLTTGSLEDEIHRVHTIVDAAKLAVAEMEAECKGIQTGAHGALA